MIIETEDPTTWIVNQTEDSIEYENLYGKKWIIYGKCNACGLCEVYEEPLPENKIVTHTHTNIINGERVSWQRHMVLVG